MHYQPGFSYITPGVKNLLFANIAIFLLQILSNHAFDPYFYLWPQFVIKKLYLWQIVSYMFLHGGMFHLLFNMFALWMFGTELERTWGTKEFLKYYFLTGIGAGIFIIIFTNSPTLGASGAIYGILAASALFFPDQPSEISRWGNMGSRQLPTGIRRGPQNTLNTHPTLPPGQVL